MVEDELIISAYFYGGPERAIDIADYSKSFLEYLETVSPWKRPFNVSGNKISTAEMPIYEDMSNFYDLLFLAWKSSRRVYYDAEGSRTLTFSELHTSPLGFSITFSDLPQGVKNEHRVSISFSMGKQYRQNVQSRNLHNAVLVSVRKFKDGERNSNWADREVIEKIMLHLISELNPFECSVWSSCSVLHEVDGVNIPHKFNWLTYITEKKICSELSKNLAAREFRDGLWFEFGRDVDTLSSPDVREAVEVIGRKIIEMSNS